MKNRLFREEFFSIIKNKKVLIPIIAVIFVPVLYAGLFLWAFWDPYAKLDSLPVVIINEDQGAEMNGEHLALGDDLVEKLVKDKQFGFEEADKKEGYQQLKDQKYYMLIEIPKDFSKNASTLMDDKPQKMQLKYVPNETYNFLSAQIGETAVEKIKTAVSEKVTETYAENIFDKITELADGMETASDGAEKVSEGTTDLDKGSAELTEGLTTLAEKSIEFKAGSMDAAEGSKKLTAGTSELNKGLAKADANLPLLIEGTEKAASGAEQLKRELPAGIAQEMEGQLTGSAAKLNAGIDQFQSQLSGSLIEEITDQTIAQQTATLNQLAEALTSNGASQELVNGVLSQLQKNSPSKEQVQQKLAAKLAPKLSAGFNQFKSGVNQQLAGSADGLQEKIESKTSPYFDQLINGISTINQNQKMLQQGIHQLFAGSTELTNGAADLTDGMAKLSDGANKLTDGTDILAAGSVRLHEGTSKLSSGTKELAEKLADGAQEVVKVHADEKTFEMMAKPVELETKDVNPVPNYGTGFAPYFLSLGLFVGALLLSIVFPIRASAGKPTNGISMFFSKFMIMGAVGIIQALIADAILLLGLDLQVQSVSNFLLFSILTSITFVALIQLLVSVLSDAGRFIAILILIFQLTTSAGTFPLELIPNFLQHFNAFLPMTYSVQGFKAVISSGDYSYMWHNGLILLGYILSFAALTILYFTVKVNYTNKKQVTE